MRVRIPDLTGQVFGWLTVGEVARHKSGRRAYLCKCRCGNEHVAVAKELYRGYAKSCGCFVRSAVFSEMARAQRTTHGMTKTRAYRTWIEMRRRCYRVRLGTALYREKGVKVCERWLDSFENFYADMGDPPPGTSIDRIDNEGNYEPGNCRWGTVEQQQNNRRNNRFLTHGGETMTLLQWSRKVSLHRQTIRSRLERGWAVQEALGL